MTMKRGPIETGLKAFDKVANTTYVGTGNVMSDVQFSSYIRARTETRMPVGTEHRAPGFLRDFDLEGFRSGIYKMPAHVERAVLAETEEKGAILYCFFHHSSSGRVVDGFVLTRTDKEQYEIIERFVTGPTGKSAAVIAEMAQRVAMPSGTHARFNTYVAPKVTQAIVDIIEQQEGGPLEDAFRTIFREVAESERGRAVFAAVARDTLNLAAGLKGTDGRDMPDILAEALGDLTGEKREGVVRVMCDIDERAKAILDGEGFSLADLNEPLVQAAEDYSNRTRLTM